VRLVCIGEGDTEYECVPSLAGRLGHTILKSINLGGLPCDADWAVVCRNKILPYVRTEALRQPDKILVVVDREKRPDCCPALATQALEIFATGLASENLVVDVSVVVCDKKFESVVMADFDLVDTLPILAGPVSQNFGANLNGKDPLSIVKAALRPGSKYDKVRHGSWLAGNLKLDDAVVFSRSRCLSKLIKEIPMTLYF
jgi:hypothetical protein